MIGECVAMTSCESWSAALESLQPGTTRCLFADCVEDVLDSLYRSAAYRVQSPPLVVLAWPTAPRIDLAIREIARQLADVAWAAAPNWLSVDAGETAVAEQAGSTIAAIDARWRRGVRQSLDAGQPPLPNGFPVGESLRRLATTISTAPLTCLFVVAGTANDRPAHLDGLGRCGQWVARQTGGRIALVLSASLRDVPALESVDFAAFSLDPSVNAAQAPAVPPSPSLRPVSTGINAFRATDRGNTAGGAERQHTGQEQKLRLWPLLGQPHPFSPGEQFLAEAISSHRQLAGRFIFNEVVETADGKRYIVDLLDRELKLVVEVDGYQHHSSHAAFAADRDRDFRLHVNGYVVLRLTHHEVVRDIRGAMEKIVTMIRFCRGNPNRIPEAEA